MTLLRTAEFGTVAVKPVVIRKKETLALPRSIHRPQTMGMNEARCGLGITEPYVDQYLFFPAHCMKPWTYLGERVMMVPLDSVLATGTPDSDEEAVAPEEISPHFGTDRSYVR